MTFTLMIRLAGRTRKPYAFPATLVQTFSRRLQSAFDSAKMRSRERLCKARGVAISTRA